MAERVFTDCEVRLRVSFSECLLSGLKKKDWTQVELARETGVSEVYISSLIHSNANPSIWMMARLLDALDSNADIREPRTEAGDGDDERTRGCADTTRA